MKQEKFIEGMWKWIVDDGLVDPILKEEFITKLNMTWVGGFDYGRKQIAHGKKVAKMDQFGKVLAIYDSAQEAANKNGVSKHMISNACLGKNITAGLRSEGGAFYYKYLTV